jgi:RNA polymerase sigma-70 factor, ECF subfamily
VRAGSKKIARAAKRLSGLPQIERLIIMSLQLGEHSAEKPQSDGSSVTEPDAWVDRHGDSLYRYALLRLGSPDTAEDVVQETFLDAIRSQNSFGGRSSERTWLVGILRHKIIDRLRKSARQPATTGGLPPDDAGKAEFDRRGHWKTPPAAWNGEPSRELETREFWEVFGRCLAKLPSGIADTFFLSELDELDALEIQQILNISPANFWKRLHRARLLLRECLESRWFEK